MDIIGQLILAPSLRTLWRVNHFKIVFIFSLSLPPPYHILSSPCIQITSAIPLFLVLHLSLIIIYAQHFTHFSSFSTPSFLLPNIFSSIKDSNQLVFLSITLNRVSRFLTCSHSYLNYFIHLWLTLTHTNPIFPISSAESQPFYIHSVLH